MAGNYERLVQPRINDVRKWARYTTNKDIAKMLNISISSFDLYRKNYQEFNDAIELGRTEFLAELKSSLFKRALGFEYEEVTEDYDADGILKGKRITKKVALPDLNAMAQLLRNYDHEWINQDREMIKIKEEELKIKREALDVKRNGINDCDISESY